MIASRLHNAKSALAKNQTRENIAPPATRDASRKHVVPAVPTAFTLNYLYLTLVTVALVAVEFLIGGTRLLFSLPSYGLLALAAVLTLFSFRRPVVPGNIFCLFSSAVFFGYMLLRLALSPVEYLARPDLFMILGALIVYLLFTLHLTAPRPRSILLVVLMVLALAHAGLGIAQALLRENFTLFHFIEPANYGIRARGMYICPDHLAGYLEVVALLAMSLALWSRWPLGWKLFAGYTALMCLIGLTLTGSRGGYLSTAFGLLIFVTLSLLALRKAAPERFGQTVFVLTSLAGIFLAGLVYLMTHQETVRARVSNLIDTQNDRLHLWDAACKQAGLSPIMGTGGGTFEIYARQFRHPRIVADFDYVHNDYLQLLAEFGVVGALVFLFFFLSHLRGAVRSFSWLVHERREETGRIRSDSLALNIGALSGAAALAAHSLVDFNLHIPANTLLLAFVFALLAHPGVALPAQANEFAGIHRWARLALPVLGLWIMLAGLPTLPAEWFGEKARVAMRDGRFAEAGEAARQALPWDRKNHLLHRYLGQAHFALGEAADDPKAAPAAFAAALSAYQAGLKLYPQEKWLLLGAAWSLDALGRPGEAEDYFKQAIFWDPNSAQVRLFYGAHLEQAARWAEANAQFQKSMALHWTEPAFLGWQRMLKK